MKAIGATEEVRGEIGDRTIYVRDWELEPFDLEQLQMGGVLCIAVTETDKTYEALPRVVAPTCECGERMEWSARLKTYCCEHEDSRKGDTDVGT